jgi:uncharacterized protein (DUF58 family)
VPTFRGWIVAAIGAGISITGRIFGSEPVVQLGYALIILLIAAVIVVRLGRHELTAQRKVTPERAMPGEPVTATIRIENHGRGSAPLLLMEDQLPAGVSGKARFAVHGIEREGWRETGYNLTPARRGRYEIGPLEISVVDPFGLARLKSGSPVRSTFVVHPRVERLPLPREPGERRSIVATTTRNPTGSRGEDFYTLREYVEGDDLRKIHWASTAKRGRYMIRQEETPWHTRATILLDDSARAHEGAGLTSSFERAVTTAASLVDLYFRVGYSYKLTGVLESGLPVGRGADHRVRCLDLLSLIAPVSNNDNDALRAKLLELDISAAPEAALFVVTGTMSSESAMALAHASRRFRQATVVSFPAHRFGSQPTKARWAAEQELVDVMHLLNRSGIRSIALGPDEPLPAAWVSLWEAKSSTRQGQWGRRPELV